jgi:HK97 family phage major capsid protein
MSKILDLIDKRAKAWDAAKKFLDTHSENGGMVSAEDAATYEKMEKEVTDLTKDIERLQRQDEIEKMMNQPTSAPITNMPGKTSNAEEYKPGRASAAYKKAFWDNIRHPGNPVIRDVLEEGTDGNGRYLVPTEFEHILVRALDENNIMRTIGCTVITTQNERKIPVANGHTQATWTAENGAYTESNPTFSQTSIDAFKLADSFFNIEGYISEEVGRAFSEAEENAFISGAIQAGATAIDRPTCLMIAAASGGAPVDTGKYKKSWSIPSSRSWEVDHDIRRSYHHVRGSRSPACLRPFCRRRVTGAALPRFLISGYGQPVRRRYRVPKDQ